MSQYTETELEQFHKLSFRNERFKDQAKDCGCFCCLEHFKVDEITDWLEDGDLKTGFCPKCGVDSIIIETEKARVDDALLTQLKAHYFPA